jgi:2-C-methyl-D-erythritol 2,4-cyclodiphosphate synthase
MKQRIAELLRIDITQVSVKGKTGEGVGEIGRSELAAATCVVLLYK